MTDGHYPTYQEMLGKVDWNKYGVVDGVARDSRCENCMVHCGYDPSGALGTNYQRGDNWKNFRYNFGTKPKPFVEGRHVNAFNGFSIGKGHLAEAKAAINSPPATNGSCSTGTNGEREDLLKKIAAAKKDYTTAIAHLEKAVRLEDSLVYTEPSEFHFPPRHEPDAAAAIQQAKPYILYKDLIHCAACFVLIQLADL